MVEAERFDSIYTQSIPYIRIFVTSVGYSTHPLSSRCQSKIKRSVSLSSSSFTNCTSKRFSGAIYGMQISNPTFKSLIFCNNTAADGGDDVCILYQSTSTPSTPFDSSSPSSTYHTSVTNTIAYYTAATSMSDTGSPSDLVLTSWLTRTSTTCPSESESGSDGESSGCSSYSCSSDPTSGAVTRYVSARTSASVTTNCGCSTSKPCSTVNAALECGGTETLVKLCSGSHTREIHNRSLWERIHTRLM